MVSPLGRFDNLTTIVHLARVFSLQSNASTATAGGGGVAAIASPTFDAVGSDASIASPDTVVSPDTRVIGRSCAGR